MSWLLIAILAYLFLAVVNVADKFIVEKVLPGPRTYAFLVSAAGMIVFLAAPWFLEWPGFGLLLLNILTGSFFTAALLFLYSSLKGHEASRVFTLVGGLVPIFVLLFSLFLFKEEFSLYEWWAIYCLVLGTVLIAALSTRHSVLQEIKNKLNIRFKKQWHSLLFSVLASLFFALFWVASKYAYNTQSFASAFIWIRLGTFLAVLLLLVRKDWRKELKSDLKKSSKNKNNRFVFFGTQGLAALGSILQNYAVSLGSVALITSLQGLQYAVLLILTFLITLINPKILKEDSSAKIVFQKILAIILITLGLYFLVA